MGAPGTLSIPVVVLDTGHWRRGSQGRLRHRWHRCAHWILSLSRQIVEAACDSSKERVRLLLSTRRCHRSQLQNIFISSRGLLQANPFGVICTSCETPDRWMENSTLRDFPLVRVRQGFFCGPQVLVKVLSFLDEPIVPPPVQGFQVLDRTACGRHCWKRERS